jgi:hypothetical protein
LVLVNVQHYDLRIDYRLRQALVVVPVVKAGMEMVSQGSPGKLAQG